MPPSSNPNLGKKVSTLCLKDGSLYIFYVFKKFGFEPIYLDGPSEKELQYVTDQLSENYCFPIKMILADLHKGLTEGADILLGPSYGIFTFLGPCKLPYTAEYKFEEILKKTHKKNFKYTVFNFFQPATFIGFVNVLGKLGFNMKDPRNLVKLRKVYKEGLRKGYEAYKLENVMRKVRARAKNPQIPIAIFNQAIKKLRDIYIEDEWKKLCKETEKKLLAVPQNKQQIPLKIGIIGDYYAIIANFPQFDIENFLARKFGAEVFQPYSLSNDTARFDKKNYTKEREKYNKYWIGGSDIITLESLFALRDAKVDGIIQLKTFGCTPEDMVTLMIEEIKKNDKNLPPILTLTFDEHSSSEGLKTRLEAFCNTIILKK
jgi:predicted nucleotide-binding protein (sugar kinase/HSP70/actin superfamily)